MLFIPQTPTQLLITREDKIIMTTQQQLYFTTLHFIEEFLSTQLSCPYPKCIEYSQQKSQTLVVTTNSIELYWTDWEHKVQLFLVLNLNNQKIFSIQSKHRWEIFGEFKQYSTKKIKLWKVQSIEKQYPGCFFGFKQFLVSSKNLAVYDHQKKDHRIISWNEASEYVPSIQRSKAQMKIFQLKQGILLLQIGSILLYITGYSVQHTLCHEGELLITKNVATWVYQGMMTIYTFEEATINNHGQMEIFDGHFYGSSVQEDKILMLFYEFREIRVRTIHLVSEQENNSFEKLKIQKNILKNQMKANSKQLGFSKVPKRRTAHFQKDPNVQVVDIAETKSYSGLNLRQALKESIGKFKEEFDKSHEQQKFDDAMLPNKQVGSAKVEICRTGTENNIRQVR